MGLELSQEVSRTSWIPGSPSRTCFVPSNWTTLHRVIRTIDNQAARTGPPELAPVPGKNTEKAEHAASCIEDFVLFPGFLESGSSRKAAAILSTSPWALLGGMFEEGVGIRRVAMPQECLKSRDVSSAF